RDLELLVSCLAIWKAGAAYIPLDPAYPKDRLEYMMTDSGAAFLLCSTAHRDLISAPAARTLTLEELAATRPAPLAKDAIPADPAYIIYTSGSTGRPKGVSVPHASVVNFLKSVAREPGLDRDDRLVAVTTLSFDIAVLELYLPLTVGATVVIAPRETSTDGAELMRLIKSSGATALQATPATWRMLLSLDASDWETAPRLRKALCGGEALPSELAQKILEKVQELWNMYGPTETTVWSTCQRVLPGAPIRIGKPLANTQVYVLDGRGKPVPTGVAGELHIGGAGVTLGYLNRPELTAERFVANPWHDPFCEDVNVHLYKTGDLVRWTRDGNLEYLRRNDSQVKVRGYRIELGEIETVLGQAPGVAQVAVMVREDRPGDVRIVGYVKASGSTAPSDSDLRAHLRSRLPEYMVPQNFVSLSSFPLTANGKVDRKKLPAPEGSAPTGEVFEAPVGALENRIAEVFAQVLGAKQVGRDTGFFAAGGHSLLATQAVSRIGKRLGVELSLRDLFDAPSVRRLAALTESRGAKADAAGQPAGAQELLIQRTVSARSPRPEAPLSLMQQRVWYLEELAPGTAVFNLPSAWTLQGKLSHEAMERALAEIIRRHDSLRTVLKSPGSEWPVAQVALDPSDVRFTLPVEDLSKLDAQLRQERLIARLHEESEKPFELTKPMWTARLFVLGPEEHCLFWMPHHLVWDGWSFDVFLVELSSLYSAFSQEKASPLAEPPIQYGDFAVWHRDRISGDRMSREKTYWLSKLAGQLPNLDMPTDRPRPKTMGFRGGNVPFNLEPSLVEALTVWARGREATLYIVLLAAFKAMLHRYTGQEDLIVGSPIQGRTQPELEGLIGFFVNTLALRTPLSADMAFSDLVRRVRETCLEAYAHQDMPFELLVEALGVPRDQSRTPVFQSFFTFQEVSNRDDRIGDLKLGQINVHGSVTPTDLSLWVKSGQKGLVGALDYASDLFDESSMQAFVSRYVRVLQQVAQDPDVTLAHLDLLGTADRKALTEWNSTAREVTTPTLHSLVESVAAPIADKVAVRSAGRGLTYGQVVSGARKIARRLRAAHGAGRGQCVGLMLERSEKLIPSLLGILESGAAYVPMDPEYPQERINAMVEDSGAKVVVTTAELVDRLPPGISALCIDRDADVIAAESDSPLRADSNLDAGPADRAYVLFTSGSTGRPKGVEVPHRAIVNFLESMVSEPGISPSDTLVAVTTLSFDIAGLELWGPLAAGAQVEIASRETAADGAALLQLLNESGATILQATPATWRLLLASDWQGSKQLRALCGGEALPPSLADALIPKVKELWNMYGPT
ncbi:MAG TPA: amino acid adenylation domain-containing protein, partial [Bdellovibrionota bacterium]|nr:amino acid adenylation domain-containing protein [Bdellovibrionota bacterium]